MTREVLPSTQQLQCLLNVLEVPVHALEVLGPIPTLPQYSDIFILNYFVELYTKVEINLIRAGTAHGIYYWLCWFLKLPGSG